VESFSGWQASGSAAELLTGRAAAVDEPSSADQKPVINQ